MVIHSSVTETNIKPACQSSHVRKLWQNLFFFLVLLRLISGGNLHYAVCIIFSCIILLQKPVIPSSLLLPHILNLIVLMDSNLHVVNPSLTPRGLTGYSLGFPSPWHSFPTNDWSAFVSAVVDVDAFDFHFLNHSLYILLHFQQMELSKWAQPSEGSSKIASCEKSTSQRCEDLVWGFIVLLHTPIHTTPSIWWVILANGGLGFKETQWFKV